MGESQIKTWLAAIWSNLNRDTEILPWYWSMNGPALALILRNGFRKASTIDEFMAILESVVNLPENPESLERTITAKHRFEDWTVRSYWFVNDILFAKTTVYPRKDNAITIELVDGKPGEEVKITRSIQLMSGGDFQTTDKDGNSTIYSSERGMLVFTDDLDRQGQTECLRTDERNICREEKQYDYVFTSEYAASLITIHERYGRIVDIRRNFDSGKLYVATMNANTVKEGLYKSAAIAGEVPIGQYRKFVLDGTGVVTEAKVYDDIQN